MRIGGVLKSTCGLGNRSALSAGGGGGGGGGALTTRALVNVDFGPASVLGVALIGCGVALYNIRVRQPLISKDGDIFFSSLGLLTGGILVFQGWRLDPLLLFSQILMTTVAVSFAAEAIQLRGQVAELEEKEETLAAAARGEPYASQRDEWAQDGGATAVGFSRLATRRRAARAAESTMAAAAMLPPSSGLMVDETFDDENDEDVWGTMQQQSSYPVTMTSDGDYGVGYSGSLGSSGGVNNDSSGSKAEDDEEDDDWVL